MNCIQILFIVSLAIIAALSHPFKGSKDNKLYEHCYKPCPEIYLPVCGFDGHKHISFASECVMEIENCLLQVKKARVFTKTALDVCENKNCDSQCTKEYNPVCGFDGEHFKTFSNQCSFDYENCMSNNQWFRVKFNQCSDKQNEEPVPFNKNCDKICTLDYAPVCGVDGGKSVTYGNMCSFEIAKCYSDNQLRLLRTGEC